MNIQTKQKSEKQTYISPKIESIILDNEISLQLESPGIPDNDDEVYSQYMNNSPYKTTDAC